MSLPLTSGLASDLIRASTEISRVGVFHRRRLLDQAAHTIRALAEQIGIDRRPPDQHPINVEFAARSAARSINRTSDEAAAALMLDAADAISSLQIVSGILAKHG